jgi:hypothetical protein
MAERLFRKYAPEDYEAISVGTEPSDSYQSSRNTSNERNWYAQGNCSSLSTENKTIGPRNEEY